MAATSSRAPLVRASSPAPVDRPPPELVNKEILLLRVGNVGCHAPTPSSSELVVYVGELRVTSFRSIFRFNPERTKMYEGDQELDDISIPHTCVAKAEVVKENGLDMLYLTCRDFRREILSFPGREHRKVLKLISARNNPGKVSATFAVTFKIDSKIDGWSTYSVKKEFLERQKLAERREAFRVVTANRNFELCVTYPKEFIVPAEVRDGSIYHVAQFRTKGRVPAFCWLHPQTGACLWRCAQLTPIVVQDMVGMAKIRCKEDFEVLEKIKNVHQPLVVVDAGGEDAVGPVQDSIRGAAASSDSDVIILLAIQQLSTLKDDMAKFRELCVNRNPVVLAGRERSQPAPLQASASTADPNWRDRRGEGASWLDEVERSRHLVHISQLLEGAKRIVELMSNANSPSSVLCQEPNGDNVCTLLVSLAQLMMDPYYRSIKGFAVLFEKEWLAFGHKFIELKKPRASGGEVVSTIFTLYLDCVWQLMRQYPQAFEFSETLLLFLLDSVYSCQFGTFLFASEYERDKANGTKKTVSIWSYVPLRLDIFRNPFYLTGQRAHPYLLGPPPVDTSVGALAIWNGYYLQHVSRFIASNTGRVIQSHARKLGKKPDNPLQLQSACLTSFCTELAPKLGQLQVLNLSNNFLNQLPCELSYLVSLRELRIDCNQITFISNEQLSLMPLSLTLLSLAGNHLKFIPESIARLTSLEYLDLRANDLVVGPRVDACTRLRHFDISANHLLELDTNFNNLRSLSFLDLSDNRLSSLPPSIESLSELIFLRLANNQVNLLPAFKNMTTLLSLDLSGLRTLNGTLNADVVMLSTLQHLNLSSMGIVNFPPTSHLPALLSLNLANNALITLPDSVATIPSLTSLNLDRNAIVALPVDIQYLTTLHELKVNHNRLVNLTPAVAALTNLNTLELSDNPELTELPPSLSKLSRTLFSLKCTNTPQLKQPPPSIMLRDDQDLNEIMAYLGQLLIKPKRVYRLKLMIVGQENVGKTSLLNNLVRKKNERQVSTDGIDIIEYKFPAPINASGAIDGAGTRQKMVKLRCWDFGGQEVYYPTHQFFLSASSVYVLVWSFLFPDELSRIEFWLDSIRYRAPQCRIILVGTHADEKLPKNVDVDQVVEKMRAKWKPRYPAIVDIMAVSNVTLKGFEEFRVLLENVVLNDQSVGAEIPASYLRLERLCRTEALIRDPPVVHFAKLREMGETCGLLSQTELTTAVKLLHNLGVLVYFHDDEVLRNVVFLNPQWLTRVMSSIITTRHTYVKRGILEHQHLRQIWRAPDFPPAIHPTLLALLNKFDLTASKSLEIKQGEEFYQGSSLVPSLLPEEPPEELPSVWPPALTPEWLEVGRRYQFSFVPRGFFSRLLVRCLHFCEPLYIWKNGLIVTNFSGTISLRMYPEKAKSYLEVLYRYVRNEGGSIVSLARLVIDAVDVLQGTWFDVPLQVLVPCSHCVRLGTPEVGLLPLGACEQAVISSARTINCPVTGEQVALVELVPDVAMSEMKGFVVRYEDLKIERELGVGGYAVVYKGVQGDKVVAVKKMNFSSVPGGGGGGGGSGGDGGDDDGDAPQQSGAAAEAFSEFRREIWIMSGLSHPCLVAMTGFCMKPCCIITEYVPCGDLYQYIHSEHPLPFEMALRVAMDIAKGMGFLHSASPPLLHRDLKSPNVLLASRDPTAPVVAKVADFGLAQALATESSGRAVANPVWLAPEIMKKKPYSFESDVYSFGVIAWELVSRADFFGETSFMSAIENRVEAGERPVIPLVHPSYRAIIEESWSGNPNERPSFITLQMRLQAMIADQFPQLANVSQAHMTSLAKPKTAATAFELSASEAAEHRGVRARLESTRSLHFIGGAGAGAGPTKLPFRPGHSDEFSLSSSSSSLLTTSSPSLLLAAASSSSAAASSSSIDASAPMEIKTFVTSSRRHTVPPQRVMPVGPPDATVTALYVRSDAAELWVGLSNGAVCIYSADYVKIAQHQVGDAAVLAVHVANGFAWIGTRGRTRIFTADAAFKAQRDVPLGGLCFATYGRSVYMGTPNGLAVFDAAKPTTQPKKMMPTEAPVSALLFTGKLMWLACGKNILRGPKESLKISNTLQGHRATITSLLEVGAVVWSASEDQDIRIWDGENGLTVKILPGHESKVTSLALVNKKMVLSGSEDLSLRSWYAEDRLLSTEDLVTFEAPITCIAVTPKGVCVSSGRSIYAWPETGIDPV